MTTRLYLGFLQKKDGNNVEQNEDASHSPIFAKEIYSGRRLTLLEGKLLKKKW